MFSLPADFFFGLFLLLTAFEVGTWQPTVCLILAIFNAVGGFLDWLAEKLEEREY